MKGSTLPIRNTKRGKRPWLLDCRYVGGAREFFETEQEAKEARAAKLSEVKHFGTSLALSAPERLIFVSAKERLAKLHATLHDAVDFYERHHRSLAPLKLKDAIYRIYDLKLRTNKRRRSAEQFRYTMQSLNRSIGDRLVSEVTRDEIERWLFGNGWEPSTIRTKLIDIQTFFRSAMARGWLIANPSDGIERIELDDKPPGILTVEQSAALMASSLEIRPEFCGFLALALFCGIRPEEIAGMTQADVSIERGYAEVRAEVAKTRQRRLVDLSENCKAWLRVGLELPPVNARGKMNAVRIKAGFEGFRRRLVKGSERWEPVKGAPWPHDALRHSFASYYLALHQSADKTAHQMGHRSTEMLFRHYRELVTKSDAEKFWSILPQNI